MRCLPAHETKCRRVISVARFRKRSLSQFSRTTETACREDKRNETSNDVGSQWTSLSESRTETLDEEAGTEIVVRGKLADS
jgi:hypothetical protein